MRWMSSWAGLLLIGGAAGLLSGVFGVGGGLIMVPIFVHVLKMDSHHATATSLAIVLLPVALPAVIQFHRAGNIVWGVVPWIALGFALTNTIGARINLGMNDVTLRRLFAVLLIYAAFQMAFKQPKQATAAPPTVTQSR